MRAWPEATIGIPCQSPHTPAGRQGRSGKNDATTKNAFNTFNFLLLPARPAPPARRPSACESAAARAGRQSFTNIHSRGMDEPPPPLYSVPRWTVRHSATSKDEP